MTPERWRRVRELFDDAVEMAPERRRDFLGALRGQEPTLAHELESLLDAGDPANDFLETPAVAQFRLDPPPDPVRDRIGAYTILRELGHGGMGTVYLAARSDQGFAKQFAIKLVRRGMDTAFILERFRNERRILADLDHPNIARILDGGSTEDGLPYFVMEYIEGRHFLEDCDARRLSTRERLLAFQKVCAAVAYAHRNLVVHRDIKPSNILVTAGGEPKLLDFGLARLLQPEIADDGTDRTATSLRFLTPDYASPEQVRGERIATSSDIYSLGVVLYELLSGRRPYRTTGASAAEIARAVCEDEPPRPSVAAPALKGDCDNIVLMALRKEPERRYATVERLSDDIRRHLEGKPVLARKDTLGYRTSKFVARHKTGVVAAAVATLLLAGATVAAIGEARAASRERVLAERHFNEVRELADSFLFEFHDAIKDLPGSTPARQLVVRRALEYLEKLSRLKTGDPALQREVATAYERVAKVQGGLLDSHLGDTRGARESLARALTIRLGLSRVGPKNRDDQAALAETRLQLSEVLMAAGDTEAALAETRAAVAILAALSAAAPSDPMLEARLARGRRYTGLALAHRGDREGALDSLDASAKTFESLAAADPKTAGYRRELAITHQMIVHALAGSRDHERAAASYVRSVDLQEELLRADPGNFSLRRELAYTHMDMGSFLEWSGEEKQALECYVRAVPLLESLAASDPRNADVRILLADAYNSVGYGQAVTGSPTAALTTLSLSLDLFQRALGDEANARARVGLARLFESYGTACDAISAGAHGSERERSRRDALAWYAKSRQAYLEIEAHGGLDRQTRSELEAVSKKAGSPPS